MAKTHSNTAAPTTQIAPNGIDFPLGKKLADDVQALDSAVAELTARLRHVIHINTKAQPHYLNQYRQGYAADTALNWFNDYVRNDCLALKNYVGPKEGSLNETRIDLPPRTAEEANLKYLATYSYAEPVSRIPLLIEPESQLKTPIFDILKDMIHPNRGAAGKRPTKPVQATLDTLDRVSGGIMALQADLEALKTYHAAEANRLKAAEAERQGHRAAG